MERPERPSRHKLNRIKIPFRPNFSSDSESEMNDSDYPIHISYCQSTPSESGAAAGPSTSTSGQLIVQSNADAPSSDMTDFVPTTNTIPLTRPEAEESQAETQDQLDQIRRKRPATSSATSSVIFENVDSIIGSSTSAQEPDTLERPANPSHSHRSSFIIRPRSFCHIDNTNTIRPPALKFKRLNGPIDLTPGSTNRDASNQGLGLHLTGGSIWGNNNPSTSAVTPNWPKRRTAVPLLVPPRNETAQSSILRHFDDMMCSTSPIIRRRIKPYTVRNSSLDDYCDLVGNFLFNCPASETSSQRSPERPGVAGPQTSATADIINRHISTTPDLISNEPSSIINDFSTLFDPEPIRNNIENEPVDQGSDDVIVVESPDINASPETYMVPSSRTPSPAETPPPSSSAATPHKQDKAQSNPSKEVPMTLDELNQSLVTLLECPVCLDHATPPIYQCCKGHILCQSCHPRLTTCPICRSRLPGDRNSVMEKVAEKLMYPCKNTLTGCSKMLKLDDKQKHEEGCGFRHYACILSSCHWKGYKPELVVHLQSNHPDKLISGAVKELLVPVPGSVPDGGGMLITHHWIQSAHNEVFNVIFHVDLYKRIMKGCVIYVGAPEKAEKFSYIFELKQQVAPFRRLLYSRTTHADTIRPCNDFSINIDVARLYRDYILHAIPVHISIVQNQ